MQNTVTCYFRVVYVSAPNHVPSTLNNLNTRVRYVFLPITPLQSSGDFRGSLVGIKISTYNGYLNTFTTELNFIPDQRSWRFSREDDSFRASEPSDICKGYQQSLGLLADPFRFDVTTDDLVCDIRRSSVDMTRRLRRPVQNVMKFTFEDLIISVIARRLHRHTSYRCDSILSDIQVQTRSHFEDFRHFYRVPK